MGTHTVTVISLTQTLAFYSPSARQQGRTSQLLSIVGLALHAMIDGRVEVVVSLLSMCILITMYVRCIASTVALCQRSMQPALEVGVSTAVQPR